MFPYNAKQVATARFLRKHMTPEEKHLWYDFLKRLPLSVYRQHNIENYIVDFYIAEKKLVIEIDGRQHNLPAHREADAERDAALSNWGITVLRYTNNAVRHHFDAVAENILLHLELSFADLREIK